MNKSKKIPSKNDCFFTYFIAPSVEFQRRGGLLEANAVWGGGGRLSPGKVWKALDWGIGRES